MKLLREFESRNITFIEPDGSWPIVWERAKGVQVWDADGKKYLDLTAAFGVAAAGHANPRVVQAAQSQMKRLLHAMGDVHPHRLKAQLARELSRITFERWTGSRRRKQALTSNSKGGQKKADVTNTGRLLTCAALLKGCYTGFQTGKTIFCNSGFEAVEAALKTAMLATGKRGIIAFVGAYHGLGYGALNATHRELFRSPFLEQLGKFAHFVPFPDSNRAATVRERPTCNRAATVRERPAAAAKSVRALNSMEVQEEQIRRLFRKFAIGAILVEPVQGRAGIRIPPPWFLPLLRRLCDEFGALLIADEVFTGFGRTGQWFACEHTATVPDLVCLGKALAGGFPISACVGKAGIMDAAWPETRGEAIHTSTFLGHPVGCAMALAQIEEIEGKKLVEKSARRGRDLLLALSQLRVPDSLCACARGLGLMAGLELRTREGRPAAAAAWAIIKALLRRGYILLPEGEHGNVISFTPPLLMGKRHLLQTVAVLEEAAHEVV